MQIRDATSTELVCSYAVQKNCKVTVNPRYVCLEISNFEMSNFKIRMVNCIVIVLIPLQTCQQMGWICCVVED